MFITHTLLQKEYKYASHSIPAWFNLESDTFPIQSANAELLGRTPDSDPLITPLLLAVPQPHTRDAVNSAPVVEFSL